MLIGLWQTKDDVEQQLLRLKSETKKNEALKIQLKFRKMSSNSSTQIHQYIVFSKKGVGQFSSTILKENLLKLIEDAWRATPPISSSQSAITGDQVLVGKQVQHRFQGTKKLFYILAQLYHRYQDFRIGITLSMTMMMNQI